MTNGDIMMVIMMFMMKTEIIEELQSMAKMVIPLLVTGILQ